MKIAAGLKKEKKSTHGLFIHFPFLSPQGFSHIYFFLLSHCKHENSVRSSIFFDLCVANCFRGERKTKSVFPSSGSRSKIGQQRSPLWHIATLEAPPDSGETVQTNTQRPPFLLFRENWKPIPYIIVYVFRLAKALMKKSVGLIFSFLLSLYGNFFITLLLLPTAASGSFLSIFPRSRVGE